MLSVDWCTRLGDKIRVCKLCVLAAVFLSLWSVIQCTYLEKCCLVPLFFVLDWLNSWILLATSWFVCLAKIQYLFFCRRTRSVPKWFHYYYDCYYYYLFGFWFWIACLRSNLFLVLHRCVGTVWRSIVIFCVFSVHSQFSVYSYVRNPYLFNCDDIRAVTWDVNVHILMADQKPRMACYTLWCHNCTLALMEYVLYNWRWHWWYNGVISLLLSFYLCLCIECSWLVIWRLRFLWYSGVVSNYFVYFVYVAFDRKQPCYLGICGYVNCCIGNAVKTGPCVYFVCFCLNICT